MTRQELIDKYFIGVEDAEAEFNATLVAMGLKSGGKKFKAQTAYGISVCRGWVQAGEIESYEKLSERWKDAKDEVTAQFTKMQSSLAQADANGSITAGESQDTFTDGNPAHMLAAPAQSSFNAGLDVARTAAQRIQHNQQTDHPSVDAAFFEGFKEGMEEVGKQQGYEPPPLLSQQQAASVVEKIVKDSRQSKG